MYARVTLHTTGGDRVLAALSGSALSYSLIYGIQIAAGCLNILGSVNMRGVV